jgi:tetratricopeptide (TPR) repeat protein
MLMVNSFAAAPAIAQQDEAAALDKRVAHLYQAGKFSEAVPLAQQLLAIREKALGPDHPSLSRPLSELANLYLAQGRYAEAEPLYKRALASARKGMVPTIPTSGHRSTTWPASTWRKVGTPTPSRSANEHWRSGRRRSVATIRLSLNRSTAWLISTERKVAMRTPNRSTDERLRSTRKRSDLIIQLSRQR